MGRSQEGTSGRSVGGLICRRLDSDKCCLGIWNSGLWCRIPSECNLDLTHGVSFTKGCYVGQELTARTQFKVRRLASDRTSRGAHKRRTEGRER